MIESIYGLLVDSDTEIIKPIAFDFLSYSDWLLPADHLSVWPAWRIILKKSLGFPGWSENVQDILGLTSIQDPES